MAQADRDAVTKFILERVQKKARLPAEVDLDSFDFLEAGYIDSISIMKFLLEIEATFDIAISDEEMESKGFTTVNGLAALVCDKIARKQG